MDTNRTLTRTTTLTETLTLTITLTLTLSTDSILPEAVTTGSKDWFVNLLDPT